MSKALTSEEGLNLASEGEKEWWMQWKRLNVLRMVKEGKTIEEIAEKLQAKPYWVEWVIGHPFFLKRLEHYVSKVYFGYQANRVMAMNEILKVLWLAATGKKEEEGLTKPMAFKYLIDLLRLKEKEPQLLSSKQFNIIMNFFKSGESIDSKKLGEIFGFEGREVSKDEKSEADSQLDSGEENKDEQGSKD